MAYDGIRAGLERLRTDGWLIVQTAAAAAIAWLLAAAVLHHQQAGFAPIGAVIAVEVTRGQQVRHAIELVLGVTLGIGVAVLLGSVIGNPPLRIAVVVGVAMTQLIRICFGGRRLGVAASEWSARTATARECFAPDPARSACSITAAMHGGRPRYDDSCRS